MLRCNQLRQKSHLVGLYIVSTIFFFFFFFFIMPVQIISNLDYKEMWYPLPSCFKTLQSFNWPSFYLLSFLESVGLEHSSKKLKLAKVGRDITCKSVWLLWSWLIFKIFLCSLIVENWKKNTIWVSFWTNGPTRWNLVI
jgi:hypothetical protein